MSFLQKLFGKKLTCSATSYDKNTFREHAVIIYFDYQKETIEDLHQLADRLEQIISKNNVGMYDGHEIRMDLNDGSLYMYGPDAEQLYKAIEKTLLSTDFMIGARAILRFGPPEDGIKQIEIIVGKNKAV